MLVRIDGAEILSRDDLHDALSRQLSLPEYYGRNLDALYDCLTDLSEPPELHLAHKAELTANLGIYADVFETVLRDACAENACLQLFLEE